MGFLIQCNNKGCGQLQTPFLDKDTNEVHCSECDQIISNVSSFTKTQMKHLKQFRQKEKKSFAIKCDHCKREDRPIIKGNDLICSGCGKDFDKLTAVFKNMLKEQLKGIKGE